VEINREQKGGYIFIEYRKLSEEDEAKDFCYNVTIKTILR